MLKKYYLGLFFWVPIPVKQYQNMSGFASTSLKDEPMGVVRVFMMRNYSHQHCDVSSVLFCLEMSFFQQLTFAAMHLITMYMVFGEILFISSNTYISCRYSVSTLFGRKYQVEYTFFLLLILSFMTFSYSSHPIWIRNNNERCASSAVAV